MAKKKKNPKSHFVFLQNAGCFDDFSFRAGTECTGRGNLNPNKVRHFWTLPLICCALQQHSSQKHFFVVCLNMLLILCLSFRWIVDMEGAPGTLYEGEKFQLLFKFSSRYPFDSPQVSTNVAVCDFPLISHDSNVLRPYKCCHWAAFNKQV